MKPRLVAIIAIVAVVGVLAFVASRFALMGDVSDENFDVFIRSHGVSKIETFQSMAASPLPLLVSIRFPESEQNGGLGFPDRTDVYTITSSSVQFECHVHIRRNRVCLVTFENSMPPIEFRERLASEFPELSVR
jgi:hypothetical protein